MIICMLRYKYHKAMFRMYESRKNMDKMLEHLTKEALALCDIADRVSSSNGNARD